jgi:hypothetical protein
MNNKKQFELYHLNNFKKSCPIFPQGKIIKSEKPDFLIPDSAKILGIEHTVIYEVKNAYGVIPKEQDSLKNAILHSAQEIYKAKYKDPLLISVLFDEHIKLGKNKVNELGKIIAEIAANNCKIDFGPMFCINDNNSELPDEIFEIILHKYESTKSVNVDNPKFVWVKTLGANELKNEIFKKEALITEYRKKCDEIWLLMVVDEFDPASIFSVSEDAKNFIYETAFDKIFLFNNYTGEYFELKHCAV